MTTRLSFDGGQTGVRMRLRRPDGSATESAAAGVRTDRPVVEQVAAAIRALADAESTGVDEVGVGLSGLTTSANRPESLLAALADVGVRRVALAHDSVSGYLGANGERAGAVIAAGTGVVTLGVTATGTARVDGWGYLFGDAGSGFWLGREGITAALRAYDGRGRATRLLDAVEERFGDPSELYMTVQADPDRVALTASFAKTVVDVAGTGDVVALGLCEGAAAELAVAAEAALDRAGWDGAATRVSHVGKILGGSRLMRSNLRVALAARSIFLRLEEPLGEPLDGVERLLDVADDHPLRASIGTAG